MRLVLAILPNGTRPLIPVAWTDWNPEQSAETGARANSHISHDLGRLGDLLHLRMIINALLSRPIESALQEGSSHTIVPSLSRSDEFVTKLDTTKPSTHTVGARTAALELLARLIAGMLAAHEAGETSDE